MELLTSKLIRPKRAEYSLRDLGPPAFRVNGVVARRDDFTLVNDRGLRLVCSWFQPLHNQPLPCLIYCHGNCGCRQDAVDIMTSLVPLGISVFAFDFAGAGLSEGETVSLGYFEKLDIRTVIEFVRDHGKVQSISLWGRSMGAAAALLYASEDHSLSLLVLDSPFTSLCDLIKDQIKKLRWIPSSLSLNLMEKVRKRIYKAAGFDINEVNPLKAATKCWAPCVFIHSVDDELISIEHSIRLAAMYPSRLKKLHKTEGGHNAMRSICLVELLGKTIHKFSGTSPFSMLPLSSPSKPTLKRSQAFHLPISVLDTQSSPRTLTTRLKTEPKDTDTSF